MLDKFCKAILDRRQFWQKSHYLFFLLCLSILSCAQQNVDDLLVEADAYIQADEHDSAVIVLKGGLQLEPSNSRIRFKLGTVYLATNDFNSAEKEFSRALQLGFSANEVLPLLAKALERSGANVALSQLEIEGAGLTSAEELEIGFRKVVSMLSLNQKEEANQAMLKLLNLDSNTVYKSLLLAVKKGEEGKLDQALQIAQEAYDRTPLNRDVLEFLANLYLKNGQPRQAAEIFTKYAQVAKGDVETTFALANLLIQLEETEKAEVYINQLLAVAPNNPMLQQLKSIVFLSAENYLGAKNLAEKAISSGRVDPSLRFVVGLSAFMLNDYEEAVAHLSLIASDLPDQHPGIRILATSLLKLNNSQEAYSILSNLENPQAEDSGLFSQASYSLMKSGDIESAKKIIEQASNLAATSEQLRTVGKMLVSLNDVSGITKLQKAYSQTPDSVNGKLALAEAYLTFGKLEQALELAKDMQKQENTTIAGLLVEAEVAQYEQDFVKAQKLLDIIIALDSENVNAHIADIKLAMRKQDINAANIKIEKLLEVDPINFQGVSAMFAIKTAQGDIKQAIDKVKILIEQYPFANDLRVILSAYQLNENEPNEALRTLSKIGSNRFAPTQYWRVKGNALIADNQLEQAMLHYRQWAELFPRNDSPILGQLYVLERQFEYSKGLRLASDFLAKNESSAVALQQSYFSVMTGNAKIAKQALKNVEEELLNTPFVKGVLARIALIEGRPSDAISNAKISYEDNNNTNNLFLYAQALDETNQAKKTYELLVEHTNLIPQDLSARILLGERQMLVDQQSAIDNYQDLLQTNPNNWVVLNNLAYMQKQTGDLKNAAKNASKAYEIDKYNIAVGDTFAQILMLQKHYKEALNVYERIMTDRVDNEEVIIHYIEALLRNNKKALAQRNIEKTKFTQALFHAKLIQLQKEFNI
jgi:putative PEP-CTERM system TPR-repeat lipoprotein